MGYYTVESGASNKRVFTAFSMPMAKEFCVSKLMKSPKMNLVICNGNYVKYDVRREGDAVIFRNRDTGKEIAVKVR